MDVADTPVTNNRAKAVAAQHAMGDDEAIAMALSMSMAEANIKTPAVEKASRTKKKSRSGKKGSKKKSSKKKSAKKSSKKKAGKKRKTCPDDGDEPYMPSTEPERKRKKKQAQ